MKGKGLSSFGLIWLVATVLMVAGGALNLSQRAWHQLPPTDGVLWTQKDDGVYAEYVMPGLAGSRAGISPGSRLIGISLDGGETYDEVVSPAAVAMYLETAGVGGSLYYSIERTNWKISNRFFEPELKNIDTLPRWTASIVFLTLVGLVWLAVGGFVLFKQGSRSPFVLHFAFICLAAFVFHVYRSIGLGQDFDLAVQLIDDLAFAFFVPLFLHFCMRYPVHSDVMDKRPWKTYVLYVPATLVSLLLLSVTLLPLLPSASLAEAVGNFVSTYRVYPLANRILLLHFVAGVSGGAFLLIWRYATSRQALVRQRLKWAMAGTIASVIPLIAFQTAKWFVAIPEDTLATALTTLPLALIPFSFGHSVVRYRLMDVDVVVRRALVYALTTIAIAMMIGAVALILVLLVRFDGNLSNTEIALRGLIAIVAMAGIVLLSEPLKNYLQKRADRFFYGERYDLRNGLLDFGRTLSATTAMDPLLDALIDRLKQVLDVEKAAVFIEDARSGRYYTARASGLSEEFRVPADFKTMIRLKSAEKGIVRADEIFLQELDDSDDRSGVRQELHYFVPCVVRSKMVAVIGLGRASDGSLLSSEDLEILRTVSGYIGVAIENSRLYQEQRSQTQELALLKEFNESIIESVNVGLLAVNEDGVITRCNTSFEQMMGIERSRVINRRVEEIFDESFGLNLDNILGKSKWHLTEIRNAYKLHTYDARGGSLIVNVAVAPLRSVSNEQTGAIVILENVSARVKLEETLQQSEKLSSIGLLAAGVAHEVNTPLTGVSSYTQMLLGMIPDTDPKHALLQKMQRQTDRAANIVGNLLNFSRTGSVVETAEIDINKLLNDTLQLLEPQLRQTQIEIVKEYSKRLPKIAANFGKLQQVFTNLILNARDSMNGGGRIVLRTATGADDEVVIEVSDTGEGIASENLTKIFDPFFTTKGVGNGTGLGLAVTYGIVQEHAGSIEAISEPGSGTTFRLKFPAHGKARQRAVS